jgi:hypothetical protein
MPNDLANLLGDGDATIRRIRPVTGSVSVTREGETVLLTIGNVEPIRLRYRTAMEEGQVLLRRSRVQQRVPLQVGTMRAPVWFAAADALKIGHWLIARGAEAKFLASDTKRVLVERRP